MLTTELGFVVNSVEDTILQKVNKDTGKECILCIYVVDTLLAAEDTHMTEKVIESICKRFQARDLGPVSFLCGMVVHRDRKNRTLTLSEPQKIKQLTKQVNMENCRYPWNTTLLP